MKGVLYFFIALAIAVFTFIMMFWLTYIIACWIDDPVYIDKDTGERHPVMPLGQVAIGFIVAMISSIVALIRSFKYFRKNGKENSI
jgi:hypothetical protein